MLLSLNFARLFAAYCSSTAFYSCSAAFWFFDDSYCCVHALELQVLVHHFMISLAVVYDDVSCVDY